MCDLPMWFNNMLPVNSDCFKRHHRHKDNVYNSDNAHIPAVEFGLLENPAWVVAALVLGVVFAISD